jgi:hypothetical protein
MCVSTSISQVMQAAGPLTKLKRREDEEKVDVPSPLYAAKFPSSTLLSHADAKPG